MVSFHGTEPAAVAAAYDFSRFTTIATPNRNPLYEAKT
jgi:hypothetical protein